MSIVSVQFKSRYSGTYGGNEYAYYADVPVSKGDIVKVPTKFGDTEAKVVRWMCRKVRSRPIWS